MRSQQVVKNSKLDSLLTYTSSNVIKLTMCSVCDDLTFTEINIYLGIDP